MPLSSVLKCHIVHVADVNSASSHFFSTSTCFLSFHSSFVAQFLFFSLPPEYVDNLKDEGRVCGIIDRLLNYLEGKGSTEEICRVYLRRIMHTYYKFDYKAHRRTLGLQGESKVKK